MLQFKLLSNFSLFLYLWFKFFLLLNIYEHEPFKYRTLTPSLLLCHNCIAGERYDFIINANQPVGAYWIQVRGLGECGIRRAQQLGILRYARGPYQPTSAPPTYDVGIPQGVVSKWLLVFHFSLLFFFPLALLTEKPKSQIIRNYNNKYFTSIMAIQGIAFNNLFAYFCSHLRRFERLRKKPAWLNTSAWVCFCVCVCVFFNVCVYFCAKWLYKTQIIIFLQFDRHLRCILV